MSWILLVLAGFMEIGGVTFLKLSEGFTRLKPSLFFVLFMSLSFIFLSMSLKEIPISIGYGIWTGIGAAGSVLIGMFAFNDPKDYRKLALVSGIIISIIGLKLVS
ncbi:MULTISPECIES: multidrug efflux SMR transporter [Bacillaceae]|uniref:DMT family transporter n=1 Tax=Bacillaceae TaxID=186817 RepID=UPI001BDF00A3|nr:MULTISPECIES: multidrug efflux SMR transporter [Bacillaceae]MDX8360351.1 multidrug efflux SMR transporter [Cytobacillus sp. IB215316]